MLFWKKSKHEDLPLALITIEAYSADVGGKIARIDKDCMKMLKVSEGDLLVVNGKSKIIVKCKQIYPSDEGRGIIRLDTSDRIKAQVEIGETVAAQKTSIPEGQKIVLRPLVETDPLDERYLSSQFLDVPLMKGEIVAVHHFGQSVNYLIIGTNPDGEAVLVTKDTTFHILD